MTSPVPISNTAPTSTYVTNPSTPINANTDPAPPSEEFDLDSVHWLVYTTHEGYTYYWSPALDHSQWDDPRIYGILTDPAATSAPQYDTYDHTNTPLISTPKAPLTPYITSHHSTPISATQSHTNNHNTATTTLPLKSPHSAIKYEPKPENNGKSGFRPSDHTNKENLSPATNSNKNSTYNKIAEITILLSRNNKNIHVNRIHQQQQHMPIQDLTFKFLLATENDTVSLKNTTERSDTSKLPIEQIQHYTAPVSVSIPCATVDQTVVEKASASTSITAGADSMDISIEIPMSATVEPDLTLSHTDHHRARRLTPVPASSTSLVVLALHTLLIVALVICRAYTAPVVAPQSLTSFTEQNKVEELKDTTVKYYHNLLESENDYEPAAYHFPPIPTPTTTSLTSPVTLTGPGTCSNISSKEKGQNYERMKISAMLKWIAVMSIQDDNMHGFMWV